jgi:hypothetical protein
MLARVVPAVGRLALLALLGERQRGQLSMVEGNRQWLSLVIMVTSDVTIKIGREFSEDLGNIVEPVRYIKAVRS